MSRENGFEEVRGEICGGVKGEEGGGEVREAWDTFTDSEDSVPSDFEISSTDVEKILDCQAFDLGGLSHKELDRHCEITDSQESELSLRNSLPPTPSQWWTDQPENPVTIRQGISPSTAEPPETVLQLFQRTVASHGGHFATAVKRCGEWKMCTYQQYYEQCCTAAKAFVKLGLDPFHAVCILGFNAPEWHISCLGAILACGVSVGLYLTSSPETCSTIASDCRAQIIVVENDCQLKKILEVKSKLPHLKAIVQYTKRVHECGEKDICILEWRHFMQLGMGEREQVLQDRLDMLVPNKCCSIIYTSGTSGKPKGVMLSHDNLTWMCHRIMKESTFSIGCEHIISYLPLSHIATQLLDIFTIIACAGTCWFAQPDALKGSLLHTMKEVRPTIFLGVPRVWERIAENLQLVASTQGKLKKKICSWAKNVGFKRNYHKQLGGSGTPLGWSIAKAVFFKKVRRALGLDRCHFPMSGGAPMSQDTLSYFMSIDIPVLELYGMSETSGPTTVTTPDKVRFMSSGRPFEGVKIAIHNPDGDLGVGEVLVSGRHLFMGYMGNPKTTSEVLTSDGWLRSGDLGYITEEGYLYITGRMKEIIITASGEKIPPRPIEEAIKRELPIISNAIVIGDQQRFLCCLVTLKTDTDMETGLPTDRLSEVAVSCCQAIGSSAHSVSEVVDGDGDQKVLKMIQRGIDHVNHIAASRIQKIAKWSILEQDFSIAGGELTPTMKLKRCYILRKYADCIETFYVT